MYELGHPYTVKVQKGETVAICRCGLTSTPPFCDGSHQQAPGQSPLVQSAGEEALTLYVCGCGKSANMPLCDGKHKEDF